MAPGFFLPFYNISYKRNWLQLSSIAHFNAKKLLNIYFFIYKVYNILGLELIDRRWAPYMD